MDEFPPQLDRFLLGVDIENYSTRTAWRQVGLQSDLKRALDHAAAKARLDRAAWLISPQGDGEICVLPEVDLLRITGPFVRELDWFLERHNEKCTEDARIRVRLAMHIDALQESALGAAGPAYSELARLLDAPPLREALRRSPAAHLALLLSEPVYKKAIVTDLGEFRVHDFTRVRVQVKTYDKPAYLHVPHHDPRTFPQDPGQAPGPDDPPGRSAKPGPSAGKGHGEATTSYSTKARTVGPVGGRFGDHAIVPTFGDHAQVQIQQVPVEDHYTDGRAALDAHEYGTAVTSLEKAVRDPAHRVEGHFLLALALLDGRRPRRHGPRIIDRVEHELEQTLSAAPEHTGALLLSAIIKQDHYEAGGFDARPPDPQELWDAADPAIHADHADHADHVRLLLDHVEAYDSAIWRSLKERRS